MGQPFPSTQPLPLRTALGLSVLDSLRAEEEPWPVGITFVRPPIFDQMTGNSSIILYGGPGSGKTTLLKALESVTDRFVIHWKPTPNVNARTEGTAAVRSELEGVFAAFALDLATQLLQNWARFEQLPDWAKKVTAWFFERFIPEGLHSPAAALVDLSGLSLAPKLHTLWEMGQANYLKPETPYSVIVDHMMKVLALMGWPGAFVLVDGLEGMAVIEREALAATLEVFLSSLFLFDNSRFHYKMFLPESLEGDLAACSAIERQRVSVLNLFWTEEDLKCATDRRLACASGQNMLTLQDVFHNERRLVDWLKRCGGASPRGWLEFLKPILADYLEIARREPARPLSEKEWLRARQRSSVRFLFNYTTGELTIGARKISSLTPAELMIIRFLYDNQGQLVSKERLYREAILPFYSGDALKDSARIFPKDYEDAINTALWRLRKEIEPDPKKPIFLLSEREKGIMLKTSAARG